MSMRLDFHAQCKALRLPVPVAEYRFHPTRRWRFDWAFPEHLIAVEQEGGAWVQGRHNRGSGFIKDCEKYGEAFALGWTVLRATPAMMRDSTAAQWVERRLRRAA